MKRWAVLIVVMAAALGAVVVSERRKPEAPVSPGAVLTVAADVQRSASRVPAVATRISDEEEIRIGEAMAARRLMVHAAASDPEAAVVEVYVQKVGAHVAARAERKLPYRFHYVPEPYFVNAYALPGGHVFIGQGLLNLMESEDELAAVLGHEVEHIDRRHCVERVQFEAQMRKLPLGAIGALAEIPGEVFQAGYTKNQELEADREGTKLAVRAGYSHQGAVHLFETYAAKQSRYERQRPPEPDRKSLRREIGKLAAQTVTGYFRSHPPAPERIRQIREMAEREGWRTRSERPLPPAVVSRINPKPAEAAATPETTPGGGSEAPPKSSARVRVSQSVMQSQAVSQPPPLYPQMARMARIEGAVVLMVVIGTTGSVATLRVVSGHPMLQQAAMDAVQQWRYRPYLLNGQPVEVETQVTVNFRLEAS